MKNILPILIIEMMFLLIITLFPPFSWGNEKLKTISERNKIEYYYHQDLPIKEYDFLLNPVTKDFYFNKNKISLERHLITSELILEYFISIILSIILYLFFLKYKFKIFAVLIYFSVCAGIILLWGYKVDDLLILFRPSYQVVQKSENDIRTKYQEFIGKDGIFTFLSYYKSIYENSYQIGYHKENTWNNIKDKIVIPVKLLPSLNKYIEEKPIKNNHISSSGRRAFINPFSDWNFESFEKLEIEKIKKYYPNYKISNDQKINTNLLFYDIDKIKLKYFIDSLKDKFSYFNVRNKYFISLKNHLALVNAINNYGKIIFAIFFISLFIYKKNILIIKFSHYLEKYFS